jgi:cation diffusion facilitator family transporter
MNANSGQVNIRVQTGVSLLGAALFIIKVIAWVLTGSNAVMTDALESVVNLTAGLVGLYSLYLAALPRDENHPYGHGRIEWISASLEGSMILAAGITILIKAIYNFFIPVELSSLDIGLVLIAVAGGLNGLAGWLVYRRGIQVHSMTLQASGKHLMSDGWSTLGLIIGLSLVLITGEVWLDNLVAIIFGIYIMYSGIRILKKSLAGIMDEMDYGLLEKIAGRLNNIRKPELIDVHNLRIVQYGILIHVDCHITAPWYMNVVESHALVSEIEDKISDLDGRPVEWFIHVDACHSDTCRICTLQVCEVRQEKFMEKLSWGVNNLLPNQNHGRFHQEQNNSDKM